MTDIETGIDAAVQDAFTRAFTNFKGTFSFERKVSRGEYSNSDSNTAAVHVQFDYAPDASVEEFLENAREASLQAKAIVFEQLGIEAHLDDGGVLREVITDAFPGATTERVERDPRDTQSAATGVGSTPPYDPATVKAMPAGDEKKHEQRANNEWAKARYQTHPQEFWDNTVDKKYENGHDYTHKNTKVGFWVD